MGYRSTVAYTIRFTAPYPTTETPTDEELTKCKASFYTFLAEAKVKYGGAVEDDCMKVDEANMALNFLTQDVKWYESYPEVQIHHDLMALSQEWADEGETANPYIGGIFMRIGEELEDIVQEGWGEHDWDWMCIHREISVDW